MPFDDAMPTRVKICGLKTAAAVETAIAGGADFIGFVFYPPSPRSLTPVEAKPLAALARGRCSIVALLVDPDDALIEAVIANVSPDMLQLHGSESVERVGEVRHRWGVPVMKAIKVETAADAAQALAYDGVADRILFDAKTPKELAGALPGGNGLSFDWHALEAVRGRLDYMLSGGLSADNVATAIRLTGAWAVDVSSGVESRPGEKDQGAITRFLAAAHGS
jgi:phosphoribosylanthranilate isomerase